MTPPPTRKLASIADRINARTGRIGQITGFVRYHGGREVRCGNPALNMQRGPLEPDDDDPLPDLEPDDPILVPAANPMMELD